MTTSNQFISVLLAFLGSSLLSVGQGFQKLGLNVPKVRRLKRWGLWTAGLPLMAASALLIQHATSFGGAALVGAVTGTGLAAMSLFSIFVLKEKHGAAEFAGVGIILGSSVLIGVFSLEEGKPSAIDLTALAVFCGSIVAALAVMIVLFRKKTALLCFLYGSLSSGIGGFVTLLQKVTTSGISGSESIAADPFLYLWIALGILSFVFLQMSYNKGKAVHIIPAFSASGIVIPVIGGVVCFSETMNFFQWAGAAGILAGVMILALRSAESEVRPAE